MKKEQQEIRKEYCSWDMFGLAIDNLVQQIQKDNHRFDGVYGLPRGGLPLAVALSHMLRLPLIVNEDEVTPHTLVADDISDSGKTLKKFKNNVIATVYSTQSTITIPNYFVYLKHLDWVIFPWENEVD